MRYGSVCSGIEAASVAFKPLGWEPAWFSEIEQFPSAVLAHHYPDVINLGDMTKLPEMIDNLLVEAPDMLCGGTPCQAFSVAGLRNSLDDARGNLSLVFCEIANVIDNTRSVRGLPPAIIFWENVPGVLNTKDNAFGCFLAGLAGEDDPVTCPDGKWSTAGLVIGQKRAVAWRTLDAQYFGLAQRRKRVFVVASARAGFDPAEVLFEFDGLRRDSAPSREARQGASDSTSGSALIGGIDYENNGHTADEPTGPLLKGSPTGGGRPLPAIAQCLTTRTGQRYDPETETETILPAVAFPANLSGTQCASSVDIAPASGAKNPTAVAYPLDLRNALRDPEKLDAQNRQGCGVGDDGEASPTLTKAHVHGVATGMQVRRLTPVECARLQGFPDDYLDITFRGKPAADGNKYKALGNSWAVPVVAWIGRRIKGAL